MNETKELPIPSIHVYYHSSFSSSSFNSLLHGMEEEGIPAVIKAKDQTQSAKLSHQAAEDSTLDVGIGIGSDGRILLHYAKLPKARALFEIKQTETVKQRTLGANAARLVKGIPFKSLEEEGAVLQEETLSKEEIAAIVKIVMKRLIALEGKGVLVNESIRDD